jgi:hypothetical protein
MRPTPLLCGTCKKTDTDCTDMMDNAINDVWGYCCLCAKVDVPCAKCTPI